MEQKELVLKQVNDVLAEIIKSATATKNFIIEQTPEIIQQLLMWEFCYSAIVCAIGIVLFSTGTYFVVKKIIPWAKTTSDNYSAGEFAFIIPVVIELISIVILTCCFNLKWLKILIAPKLYLIEYAVNIIK